MIAAVLRDDFDLAKLRFFVAELKRSIRSGPVDGSEIHKANHLEVFQTLGNNMNHGINYQPQPQLV